MKKISAIFILAIALLLILPGCDLIPELTELLCDINPDSSHCYQQAAVGSGNSDKCAKVTAPPEYKKMGSNPPKDKCYLMVAQETGKYADCSKIAGGYGSYTKEECISGIATDKMDVKGCSKLSQAEQQKCTSTISSRVTSSSLKDMDTQISDLKDKLASDPTDSKTRAELSTLQTKKDDLFGVAPAGQKSEYTRDRINSVIGDVDDEDVSSDIKKAYIAYKVQNPNANIDTLMTKLETIKDEKQLIKSLDEKANTLVDQLKTSVTDYAQEEVDEKVGEIAEEGWKWAKNTAGYDLKKNLNQLEEMKAKYDKASEQYKSINEKIEKFKKVYDEVNEVYTKVDKINKLIAEGRLDKGKADVLKGGVYLGKGLEYATSYVPVFGSTISTVTKETFDAAMKLANARAQRTHAINKCIDDPEHCDTDGISGY
jgi:hypothetical protein